MLICQQSSAEWRKFTLLFHIDDEQYIFIFLKVESDIDKTNITSEGILVPSSISIMKVIGDLPSEVMDKIFSMVDRESKIAASNVCLSWRKIIHELTFLSALKCDSDVKEKLKKCGWIFGEHDFENCNCIKLNTGLLQFIANVPLLSKEVTGSHNYLYSLLSNNKLLLYSCRFSASIQSYELNDGELERNYLFVDNLRSGTEEINGICFEVKKSIQNAVVQDQTLVIYLVEEFDEDDSDELMAWICMQEENGRDADSDEFFENISTAEHFTREKIMVWNHETYDLTSELNFHEKAIEFIGGRGQSDVDTHIEVRDVAIGRHTLAVNFQSRSVYGVQCFTQIWKLDTEHPDAENLRYCSTVGHGFSEKIVCNKLFINSKILCFQASKGFELFLQVFLNDADDHSFKTTISIGQGSGSNFNIKLDEGISKKIAVFNKLENTLKIYTFFSDTDTNCLEISLSHILVGNPGRLVMANFLMGKLMFILEGSNQFQCIIVTEEGEVIEGNNHVVQLDVVREVPYSAEGIVTVSRTSEDYWAWGRSSVKLMARF